MAPYKRPYKSSNRPHKYVPRKTGSSFRTTQMSRKSFKNKKLYTPGRVIELKNSNDGQEAANVSTTGALMAINLFDIEQGLTAQNRIGRTIQVKKLQLKYTIGIPLSSTGTNEVLRVIVGIDHQCNGAVALVSDILQDADYLAFRNLDNARRFTFLQDRYYPLQHTAGGPSSVSTTLFNETEEFHQMSWDMDLKVEYDASTGAITDLTSNNFFILVISKNAKAIIDAHWRIRYTG